MPRAKCYYEILGVRQDSSEDEIKRAYRSLALKWHPDKNHDNADEAHSKFLAIHKAYETLSDSRERSWYDRHKDQILAGSNKDEVIDKCLDLFPFFSSSCFAGHDDSPDGFYTVYRNVFQQISKEEIVYMDEDAKLEEEFPTFGTSESSYVEVVRKFYAFWSSFCTKMTFDFLDKYNITEAENRRILRLMEKENKKLKDPAKKERNDRIRALVEFVKKRDKRIKAYKISVDKQVQQNRLKTAEKQRQQREKQAKEIADYKATQWQDVDSLEEELRKLEAQYDNAEGQNETTSKARGGNSSVVDNDEEECSTNKVDLADSAAGDENEVEDEEEEDDEPDFFCLACNKDFRSAKSLQNHEASKKHKQNLAILTKLLKEEESLMKRSKINQ